MASTTAPPPATWVLLHGTPLTPAVWAAAAAQLGAHGAVACPSAAPLAGEEDPQRAVAERVLAALAPAARDLHIVGHSFGGQVAMEIAIAAPGRVRSLTLLCTRDSPYPEFAGAAAALLSGTPADTEAAIGRWFSPTDVATAPEVVDYARGCLQTADPLVWATALSGIATYDRTADVGRIAVPVTLVAAALDPVSTPDSMRALADRLPNAHLVVDTAAAHMTVFTDPDRLSNLLLSAAGVRESGPA